MEQLKIGVVGIGLIGGSILKSLSSYVNIKLYGVSNSQITIDKTVSQGLVHCVSLDYDILKSCDVVFITTPMNKTLETIDKVANVVSEKCIIADAASLKVFVLDYINKNQKQIRFIGTHPMAGTENKGIDSSFDGLFIGSKWVVIPSKWSDAEAVDTIENIIKLLKAEPIITTAEEHDKSVALISHMPMLLSQALFSSIENIKEISLRNLTKKLAASGFRDMTRLAMTNSEMAKDMINMNTENIQKGIELVEEEVKKLIEPSYFDLNINKIIEARKNMYSDEGKNIS